MQYDITFLFFYSLILLCIGSVITAFLHRWPLLCEFRWNKEAHDIVGLPFDVKEPPSFIYGRSQCTKCNKTLSFIELIPVFSYLIQLGKCRHCQKKINIRYFMIEIATLLFCIPLIFIEVNVLQLFLLSSIFCCLLTVAIFDYHHQWIPDELNGILIFLSLVLVLHSNTDLKSSVYGVLFGYGGIYIIRLLFLKLRNIEVIGLGDAKLLAGIGAWLGVGSLSYVLFIASILGIITFLFHRQRQTAFGPYLCTAAYLFFWNQIL
ncbi:prepilin peptidase [Marinomonas sp. 15G1-11]|uniref:Prepilin leader peptidase/N-methyltransferase n=1 Tax=Marinomonas phaeophyticola TaxID=3004091 RepID=A0ABT4JQ36_9GAMM|nr:A24 family peptidase [Marinomonas sp. 15G1-11]MCZ2720472.1 prepilin peptidase [Marinomonas sp. 15G1-11]